MVSAHEDGSDSIETLLAMLEHEVRSPLNAIVGFANLLRADLEPAELERMVSRIRSNAELLGDVVEGLAGVSSHSGDRRARGDTSLVLEALLDDVLESARVAADEKGLDLRAELGPGLPDAVPCRRGALRVILQNLVSNAVKFTDRGHVVLRVGCVHGNESSVRLRYSVTDTGCGIPEDQRSSILEPFVRGESSEAVPGDGLGLAICSKLLRDLGSHIEFYSDDSGGTTLGFELVHGSTDAIAPTVRCARPRVRLTSNTTSAEARVLLVDDDEDSLELLRRLVKREGFVTDVARSGRTALSMIGDRDYTLVMTDLRMTGMSGVELTRRIRRATSQNRGATPRLIAVTASAALREPDGEYVGDVFDEVLLKPIRPRVLTRMLDPHRNATSPVSSRATPAAEQVDTSVFAVEADYPQRRARDLRVLRDFLVGGAPIEDVIRIGHRMKGTAAAYGYPRLGELGAALEAAGQAGEVSRIGWITDMIERFLERAKTSRRSILGEEKRGA